LAEFEIAGKRMAWPHGANSPAANGDLPLLGQADGTLNNLPLNEHRYPFRIQVSLASPELLYARQSRRTRLFGALIVASAIAAVAGLFAAWRSFRRQQELNELKSNFVSSVSHELRAPIASVRLMAENLDRGKISEPARQGEYFRFIVQECRRLSSLIENVLDFSRIEQGRKQYEFEPTNLVTLVETTVKLMEPGALEKGVRLELHSTLRPPNSDLVIDGRAIQQALVNLIDNAVKHSPKGETVTVGIESGAGGPPARRTLQREQSFAQETPQDARGTGETPVLLYVADHGPGIPASEQEKIFERFYRLGSELRRETQGVGIGLSVVKHIVEAHRGRVRVDSAVGKGSRFTIELPFKK
jgi:signal transduction histidine kinase